MIRIYLRFPSFFSSSTNTNRMFETFSFLPPLSDADLTKQVQYLLNNGWTPCLEFEDPAHAYTDGHGWSGLDSSVNANYYDNRYWVMWKLPMYGCNNADEVIQEVKACVKAYAAAAEEARRVENEAAAEKLRDLREVSRVNKSRQLDASASERERLLRGLKADREELARQRDPNNIK